MLYSILENAINLKASDIHINKDSKVLFRINNKLCVDVKSKKISTNDIKGIVAVISNGKIGNYSLQVEDYILRVNIQKVNISYSISIRVINKFVPNIEQLNLPNNLKRIKDIESGLVLVCGKTGSGKSTTLASIIRYINEEKEKKIITLEDPIEYIHESKKSLIVQREKNRDFYNYDEAISECLRSDPDIIVIGEMLDLKTIRAVLNLANTGHLVLSTLHTGTIEDTISRIIDVFSYEHANLIKTELATSLKVIITQKLVSLKDTIFPICEVLYADKSIKNIIKTGKDFNRIKDQLMFLSERNSSLSEAQCYLNLIREKKLDIDDIKSTLEDKEFEILNNIIYN